jgi:hypothetical protein
MNLAICGLGCFDDESFCVWVVGSLSWKAGFGGAGGVHPTLRKMREGWRTRAFDVGRCGRLRGEVEKRISPLRFAPVEMTMGALRFAGVEMTMGAAGLRFGRNDNGSGFPVQVLCRLSAVAWRVGIVAGLGEGAGSASSSGCICIMRSRSRATALLGLAVSEISVRGARMPSSGSVVISSTVSGAGAASRSGLGRLRLAIWRP